MDRNDIPKRDRSLVLSIIFGAILLGILVVAFLIVNTILRTTQEVTSVPENIAEQVDEVLNPTPTIIADPQTVIRQVQNLSRLETASYTIEKVITADSGEGPLGFLFSDRLLLVAQGQVIAGVDLSRIGEGDIQVTGETVYITLPAAEIFVATLDNDETYVYDRQTAPLGQQVDLETLARQEAERVILEAALEDDILGLAQDNAEVTIAQIMYATGFEEVIFITGTPSPDQNQGD
jgi:hypothetical protein